MSPRFKQHQPPPEASEATREAIRQALETENYFIYKGGLDFLFRNGFDSVQVIQDLITYIKNGYKVYIMLGTDKAGKFQCVLNYSDIEVYTKLSKKEKAEDDDSEDDAWFLALDFHPHNTGHKRLHE